jgi:hypothetical protein
MTKLRSKTLRYAMYAAALMGISISIGCTKFETSQPASVAATPTVPQVAGTVTLQPLFVAASECFDICVGRPRNRLHLDTPILLPEHFKDFIAHTDYGAGELRGLLSQWPGNFQPLLVKDPSERPNMDMEGSISYVIDFQGDPIQIYENAGFPKRSWTPGPYRRDPGTLTVAVDPKTKTMAAEFNGPEDLSEYRFAGDEKLIAVLLAYTAAEEAEVEKAYLKTPSGSPEDAVFPVPADRRGPAEARLSYLNSLYRDKHIVGARSAYDAGENAHRTSPEKQWWAANSSLTACFETGGPAAKLDEFVGFTDKPRTQDFKDSNGKLIKVEVINSADGDVDTVWTFYKEKAQCETEQINATKALADKYR